MIIKIQERWVGLRLGGNFVDGGAAQEAAAQEAAQEACRGWIWAVQYLSICSTTEENHGETRWSWPVAGPSGYVLTSSQQTVTAKCETQRQFTCV